MTNPVREGNTHRFEVIQIVTGADERLEQGQRTFWKRDDEHLGRVYEVVLLTEIDPRCWVHTLMLPNDARRFYKLRDGDERREADNYRYFVIDGKLRENVWNDAGDDFTEHQPDRAATERVMDFLADSLHDNLPDASLGGSLANADIHISFSVPFPKDAS